MNTKLNQTTIEKLDAEKIDSIGTRWTKKGDRLYLSDEFKLAALGLEVERYRGGAISSATQKYKHKMNYVHFNRNFDGCRVSRSLDLTRYLRLNEQNVK